MDPVQVAEATTSFLVPFLPYLCKAGEKAAEAAGKKLGGQAWDTAKGLWDKLWPKLEARPAATEAVQDLATSPVDTDAAATLRGQLKKMLAEDEALLRLIGQLMDEGRRAGVIATGGAVVIGGSVSQSTIITGDANTVNR